MTGAKIILYIEDDPASRVLVERTLRFAGYEVQVAACGLEGVDIARATAPDLILTDINLPDISGREVTTMLRDEPHLRHVPIVALTAQTLDEQREMSMASGINGYLTKPIDIEALPDQIERYLGGAQDQLDADRLADAQKRYTREVVTRLEARIRELERTNDKLRRLDKMKDSFIQLTAHELRTPLTLVYGYSRLLEDSPALKPILKQDETAQNLAHGLVEAVERMQVIVNEIVMVSRIMTHQIEMSLGPVNLITTVQKVLKQYEPAFQKRHLHVDFNPTTWPHRLLGDGELLALVIGNLISNAIKYTPDDGCITLTATGTDEEICIRIKDTGIGVARDEQTRIFDRFHTAEDTLLHSTSKTAYRGGGLGLGLAVCKAVVEAHGGSIRVESPGFDPDRLPGSEFIVVLPVIPAASESAG